MKDTNSACRMTAGKHRVSKTADVCRSPEVVRHPRRIPVLAACAALLASSYLCASGSAPDAWRVGADGAVSCSFGGVEFSARAPVPAAVKSSGQGRVELELTTPDGPVKAVWQSSKDGALELSLSAPHDRKMSEPLAYPAGWETGEGDDLVLPIGEGVAYPVCDPEVPFTLERCPFRNGMSASIGLFGVARQGVWAMAGVEDVLCAEILCRTNAPYAAGVRWLPADGRWGGDRRLRFFFAKSVGEVASGYRAWREDRLPWCTCQRCL